MSCGAASCTVACVVFVMHQYGLANNTGNQLLIAMVFEATAIDNI